MCSDIPSIIEMLALMFSQYDIKEHIQMLLVFSLRWFSKRSVFKKWQQHALFHLEILKNVGTLKSGHVLKSKFSDLNT